MTYRTTKNGDGSVVIHDVEVFAEFAHPTGFEFDEDWIERAVAALRQKEAEGYLPPIHVLHHEDGAEVEQAGFFRVTGTEMLTLDGKRRLGVLADLTITNPDVAQRIQARQLPYRSVEILNVENPTLDTLALLDHQPPALKFPMLGMEGFAAQFADAGEFTFQRNAIAVDKGDDLHVVASASGGKASRFLFRAEPTMDKDDDKVEMADGETGGIDAEAVVAAIEDGSIPIGQFDALQAAMEARASAAAETPEVDTEDDDDDEPELVMAGPDPEQIKMSDPASQKQVDPEMAAKLFALEARLAKRDEAEACQKDVAAALKRLDGRAMGSDAEVQFSAFRSEHGAKAFSAYVDSLAKTLPMEMTGDQAAIARLSDSAANLPDEVKNKYQDPDKQGRAAFFAAEYQDLVSMGATPSSSLDRYIEVAMRREAAANI